MPKGRPRKHPVEQQAALTPDHHYNPDGMDGVETLSANHHHHSPYNGNGNGNGHMNGHVNGNENGNATRNYTVPITRSHSGGSSNNNMDIFNNILSGGGVTTSGGSSNSSSRSTSASSSQSSNMMMDSLSQIQSLASLQSPPIVGNGHGSSASNGNGMGVGGQSKIQMSLLQLRELSGQNTATSRTSSRSTTPSSSQEVSNLNHLTAGNGNGNGNSANEDASDLVLSQDSIKNKRKKRAPTPKPAASRGGGRQKRNTSHQDDDDDDSDDDDESTKKQKTSSTRFDNSLVQLTKKFIDLVEQAPDCILDLKVAAEKIEITKRRIYDVTCVLEGVGLIEKCSKNQVQWRGVDSPLATTTRNINNSSDHHLNNNNNNNNNRLNNNNNNNNTTSTTSNQQNEIIKQEIKKLTEKEASIDQQLKSVQKNIQQHLHDATASKLFFVTYNDLREIEQLRNDTLIAIKAPAGTKLEVPDPDEGMEPPNRRYQIFLNNENAMPIDVFLLSQQSQVDSSLSDEDINNSLSLSQVNQVANTDNINIQQNNQQPPPSPIRSNSHLSTVHFSNQNTSTTYWEPPSTIASYSPFDAIQQQQQQTQQTQQQQFQSPSKYLPSSTTPPHNSLLGGFQYASPSKNNHNHHHHHHHHQPHHQPTTNNFLQSPIKSATTANPLQYTFADHMFETSVAGTDSEYYFDSVIDSEGLSELYTDESFLAQSYDHDQSG